MDRFIDRQWATRKHSLVSVSFTHLHSFCVYLFCFLYFVNFCVPYTDGTRWKVLQEWVPLCFSGRQATDGSLHTLTQCRCTDKDRLEVASSNWEERSRVATCWFRFVIQMSDCRRSETLFAWLCSRIGGPSGRERERSLAAERVQ